MRSLGYVLGGKAVNFDDCIDKARIKPPRDVSIRLLCKDIVGELFIVRYLYSIFDWNFDDYRVEYEETLGACFSHESFLRQKRSIDNANQRLENRLRKIEKHDIKILSDVRSFDYSAKLRAKEIA